MSPLPSIVFRFAPIAAACAALTAPGSAQNPASLVYSTQLGDVGGGSPAGRHMTIDEQGFIYLLSYQGPLVSSPPDADPNGFLWLAKLDPAQNGPNGDPSIVWTTKFVATNATRPHDVVAGGGYVFVSGWAIDGQLGRGNVFKPTKSVFRDGFVAMFDATDGTRTATTYLSAEQPNEGADIDPLCMRLAGGALFVGGSLNGDALYLQNAFHPGFSGGRTAFVMRLQVTAPDGLDLAWSSYLPGGSSWDEAYAIAADGAGGVYVAGASESTVPGFPTGGWQAENAGNRDAVVFRVDDSGAMPVLDAGTYLGGTKYDEALAISLAPSGAVWIAGRVQSSNFPTTLGAWDVSLSGKSDGFVARFDATLSTLEMASYFGGNRDDHCEALVFRGGVAYLAGQTRSTNLPTVGALPGGSSNSGREDAFLARVDANGQPLHLTYLGGSRTDNAVGGLELDAQDRVVVGGQADSTNFPVTSPTSYGGTNYVAVVSLN